MGFYSLIIQYFIILAVISCKAPGKDSINSSSISEQSENTVDHLPVETLDDSMEYAPILEKGDLELNVQITDGNTYNKKLWLYETQGTDYFPYASASIDAEGNAIFELKNISPGVYKIGFDDLREQLDDVILNPAEKNIIVIYSHSNLRYSFQSTSSTENQLLNNYSKIEREHNKKLENIKKSSTPRAEKLDQIYSEEASLKQVQDALRDQYPDTYFGNMVSHLQSSERFNKEKYWDDLNFQDVNLIRSLVFHERIQDYMRTHASKKKSSSEPRLGFYNAVDEIALKIKEKGSDEVLEHVLYTMSEGFYSSGMEDLSLYVVDNYFYGDGCGDADISELIKRKAAGVKQLQIGKVPPNISNSTIKNQKFNLHTFCGNNEYTLVIFWASFCHKCEREIPQLVNLYKQFHPKGFDICAVSVDSNLSSWQQGILKHSIGAWNNVSDLKGWRGDIAKNYRVSSTPVMFLLDKDAKIVARPKTVSELTSLLQKKL